MIYLNDTVSLLRSEGHTQPQHYPVWRIWDEAKIIRRRINQNYKTLAAITMIGCGTGFSGGKDAHDNFSKFLERFDDGEDH